MPEDIMHLIVTFKPWRLMKLKRLYGAHYHKYRLIVQPQRWSAFTILNCFARSPGTNCKLVHSMLYPVNFVFTHIQSEFWMGDNADHKIFSKHPLCLCQWPRHIRKLTDIDFTKCHSSPCSHFQMYTENKDVQLVWNPSLIVLHTILMPIITEYCNKMQYTCDQKPHWVARVQSGDGGQWQNIIFSCQWLKAIPHWTVNIFT